jgi:hypothetical protein
MPEATMICDFCSSPAPAWRYPADSFTDIAGSRSVEDWLACEECHLLIVLGDRDALARRSLRAPGLRVAVAVLGRAETIRYCRDLHDRFWNARRGEAFRIAA